MRRHNIDGLSKPKPSLASSVASYFVQHPLSAGATAPELSALALGGAAAGGGASQAPAAPSLAAAPSLEAPSAAVDFRFGPGEGWLECTQCSKWRRLPGAEVEAASTTNWTCSESTDPGFNNCSLGQELTNVEIDALLDVE